MNQNRKRTEKFKKLLAELTEIGFRRDKSCCRKKRLLAKVNHKGFCLFNEEDSPFP